MYALYTSTFKKTFKKRRKERDFLLRKNLKYVYLLDIEPENYYWEKSLNPNAPKLSAIIEY